MSTRPPLPSSIIARAEGEWVYGRHRAGNKAAVTEGGTVIRLPTRDESESVAQELGNGFASDIATATRAELMEIESDLLSAWDDALYREPRLAARLNVASRLIHTAVAVLSTDGLIGG